MPLKQAEAAVIFSDSFASPVDGTPSQWTTTDNWKIRQLGAHTLAVEEDASASGGRKLTHDFGANISNSWTADFEWDWKYGGSITGANAPYGSYSISVNLDMVDTSNNGYRVRIHQGTSGNVANTAKVSEVFRLTGGTATLLGQGGGYNTPGWKTLNASEPKLKWVRLGWEQDTGRLRVFTNGPAGQDCVLTVTDTTYASFRKVVLTAANFTTNERPCVDNVVISEPTRRRWGVAGHPQNANYNDLTKATQIDLVKELGCDIYRIDTSNTGITDALIPIAAAQGVTLLPIVTRSPSDTFNPVYTDQQVYQMSYNKAKAFATSHAGQFPYIELDNELENKCIVSGDGSRVTDYAAAKVHRMKLALRGLSDGVRDGDPNAKRLIASCGWYHYGFMTSMLTGDPNAPGDPWAVDSPVEFEIVNWHWYSSMGSFSRVLKQLSAYGKPIWITETNRRDGTMGSNEAAQAEVMSTYATEMWNFPLVETIIAYELVDSPWLTGGEAFYGLCQVAENPVTNKYELVGRKPGFYSYQERIGALGTLPPSGDIIVDDAYYDVRPAVVPALTPTFSANWVSASTSGQHFKSYRHDNATNKTGLTARFRPVLTTSGSYVVSLWFPSAPDNSAATPVTIKHAGGTMVVNVDQRNGGRWVVLGTFSFNATVPNDSAYVEISNAGTTGRVVADAVRFHQE